METSAIISPYIFIGLEKNEREKIHQDSLNNILKYTVKVCAEELKVDPDEVWEFTRLKTYVEPRRFIFYIMYLVIASQFIENKGNFSTIFSKIEKFTGYDRTTVRHHIFKLINFLKIYKSKYNLWFSLLNVVNKLVEKNLISINIYNIIQSDGYFIAKSYDKTKYYNIMEKLDPKTSMEAFQEVKKLSNFVEEILKSNYPISNKPFVFEKTKLVKYATKAMRAIYEIKKYELDEQ